MLRRLAALPILVMILLVISIASLNSQELEGKPFPLNQTLHFYDDSFIGRTGVLRIEYRVDEVSEPSSQTTYRYFYKAEYNGWSPILFHTTIFDRVMGGGNTAPPIIFPLEQNKPYILTIKSSEAPVYASGPVRIWSYYLGDDPVSNEVISGRGIEIFPNEFYSLRNFFRDRIIGPLPPSFVHPKYGEDGKSQEKK